MARITSFIQLLSIVPILLGTTAAVECDRIDKYTIEHFFKNTCSDPGNTCVFYTFMQDETSRAWARSQNLNTVYELWDSTWFEREDVDTNSRRCIMADRAQRNQYFMNMSAAMALKCQEFAFIFSGQSIGDVPLDGFWGTIEFPRLRMTVAEKKAANTWLPSDYGNQVDSIDYVKGPDGTDRATYWKRGQARRTAFSRALSTQGRSGLARRQTCGADEDAPAAFQAGGEFEVDR